jgi:hypothetical protein
MIINREPHAKPGPRKKKKAYKKPKTPEKVIQAQVDAYLTLIGVRAIRLPDALFRAIYANQSVSIGTKSQIAKNISGLPDLMIPKLTDKGLMILPLELKTESGKLGPKQIKWKRVLGTVVAHSFEQAKEMIDNFLKENEE